MNSFKYKVLFRCDAANIPEIGTGHLYRCLTIALLLKKKYNLKYHDIAFAVKSKNEFEKSLTILKAYKFKIIKIKNYALRSNTTDEAKYLVKNSANLLIIDRLGKTNMKFFEKIKNSFKKKIIIDDASQSRKYFDLSLNPLIHNVSKFKNSFIGFNYLILPTFFFNKNNKMSKKNNIFIFFGGHDYNNFTAKIVKILNHTPFKLNIFIHKFFKKEFKRKISKNNLMFFDGKNYTKSLNAANIAIIAGGISLFDSIYLNKKIICIPQYEKQEINAKKASIRKVINLVKITNANLEKKFYQTFYKIYGNNKYQKNINKLQKKIINSKKLGETMKLIFNLYEETQNQFSF